ncbi:hypothetical protein SNEBB_008212 [Seison nebaliae]|nr:hypothetical protein SNEBB_008212 [Seison nebaliae]
MLRSILTSLILTVIFYSSNGFVLNNNHHNDDNECMSNCLKNSEVNSHYYCQTRCNKNYEVSKKSHTDRQLEALSKLIKSSLGERKTMKTTDDNWLPDYENRHYMILKKRIYPTYKRMMNGNDVCPQLCAIGIATLACYCDMTPFTG